MIVLQKECKVHHLTYIVRSARDDDAKSLSEIRLKIDGETENLDREKGEAYIDESGFKQIIQVDSESMKNLFLVAEMNGEIIGFSRCEGSMLKRLSHKVEFGICVLKEYWGYRVGTNLLIESIRWADANNIKKMTLSVLETNVQAIKLYKKYGFEVEGILKNDKQLSDGKYYHTLMMGRWND